VHFDFSKMDTLSPKSRNLASSPSTPEVSLENSATIKYVPVHEILDEAPMRLSLVIHQKIT
jgi:hypothetical protein